MKEGQHFWGEWGPMRWFKRGDMKYLLLTALLENPKHGYEIIKDLEKQYGGFYSPSPGTVYPTLQMLEDLGYVKSVSENGKRVFEITDEGREFLSEDEKSGPIGLRPWEISKGASELARDIKNFGREFRDLSILVGHSVKAASTDSEKLAKIREIVAKTKRDIYKVLGEDSDSAKSFDSESSEDSENKTEQH